MFESWRARRQQEVNEAQPAAARHLRAVLLMALAVLLLLGGAFLWSRDWMLGRPLFCRWKPHDLGAHWQREIIAAGGDAYVYVDKPLNMVLVARLDDSGIRHWREKLRPGYAVLFEGTPFEATVRARPNTLVILERGGTLWQFDIPAGFAERVLHDCALLVRHDILDYLDAVYAGADKRAFDVYLSKARTK
jgi:hypothetical protein